jgi:hypothetical protein
MKSFDSKIPVSIVAEAFADYIMTNIQIIASQKLCHTCLHRILGALLKLLHISFNSLKFKFSLNHLKIALLIAGQSQAHDASAFREMSANAAQGKYIRISFLAVCPRTSNRPPLRPATSI